MDIAHRLHATLELIIASMILSVGLGVPIGVLAALRHNEMPDFVLRVLSVLGVAVATFWFAIMLQLLFSLQLHWLPLRGELSDGVPPPACLTEFLLVKSVITRRWDA